MKPAPARKQFGQHFLVDGNIIRKIVDAIGPRPGEHFLEIGPGRGALTAPLLAAGVTLDALEIDRDLAASLRDRLPAEDAARCTVHAVDALRFDPGSVAPGQRSLRLAGNLPYNISTPLLFHLLAYADLFADLHVMLQKEVGDRIAAPPGSRTYGRLSIAIGVRCQIEKLFGIAPGSFRPPPKVDSVFLRLTPFATPRAEPAVLAMLDRLIARAFTMRRKRLGNAVRGVATDAQIEAAGLDSGARPEQLSPDEWLLLARFLDAQGNVLAKDGTALSE